MPADRLPNPDQFHRTYTHVKLPGERAVEILTAKPDGTLLVGNSAATRTVHIDDPGVHPV